MKIYENAVGPCVKCGTDATGSLYWTPLPDAIWQKVRPHVLHLFPDRDRVSNIFFVSPGNNPLCGAKCATLYNEAKG